MHLLRDTAFEYRRCPGWQRQTRPGPQDLGCHAIQIRARAHWTGWPLLPPGVRSRSFRTLATTTDWSAASEFFNWGTWLSLYQHLPGYDGWIFDDGGQANYNMYVHQPKCQAYEQTASWSVWADIGDGPQWYPVSYSSRTIKDTLSDVVLVHDFSNSCGDDYHYALDDFTGDIYEYGTLASMIHGYWSTNTPYDFAWLMQYTECPFYGSYAYFQEGLSPLVCQGEPCDYVDCESDVEGYWSSRTYFTDQTLLGKGPAQTFGITESVAGDVGWDFVAGIVRAAANTALLGDLGHDYGGSVFPTIIPRVGIYDQLGASLYPRLKLDVVYGIYWSAFYAGDWPLVDVFPFRWVIVEIGTAPEYGGTLFSGSWCDVGSCDVAWYAERALVGILGQNYQTSQGQDPPYEGQTLTPGAGKCVTEPVAMVDCVNNFLPAGTQIIEPELMIFDYGRLQLHRRHNWGQAYDELGHLLPPTCLFDLEESWTPPC